jgi:hypothetical protein
MATHRRCKVIEEDRGDALSGFFRCRAGPQHPGVQAPKPALPAGQPGGAVVGGKFGEA